MTTPYRHQAGAFLRILSDNRRQIPFMRRRYPLSAAHVVNAPFCGHSSGLPLPRQNGGYAPGGRTATHTPPESGIFRRAASPSHVESIDKARCPQADLSRLPRNAGAFVPEEHEQKRSPAEASPCPCRDAVSGTSSNTGPATRSDSPPVQPPKYRIGPPYPKAVPSRVVRMRHSHLRPHIIIFVSRPVWM